MDTPLKKISEAIKEGDSFLIVAHVNPDGDAIGSSTGMGHILKALGKRFTIYNATGLPSQFDWMQLPSEIVTAVPDEAFDWTIVLDCGALNRVGPDMEERLVPERIINIDHHLSNHGFGGLDWVDVSYPAVGAMVGELADALNVPLSGPLAEAVYVAIATDTGFFTYGSTTPEILELTARLYRDGIRPGEINPLIINQWSPQRLELLAEVLSTLTMHLDGKMGVVAASQEMMRRTGTTAADTDGMVNFVRRLRGLSVSAILREDEPEYWKFSLRSNGTDDIQDAAALLGGGGHRNAAGGNVEGPLTTARETLVAAIAKTMGLGD